jgi:hypothetical protein
MAEIININYLRFRKYLRRRDEVGHQKAICELKQEQIDGMFNFAVSAGSHQNLIEETDLEEILPYVTGG